MVNNKNIKSGRIPTKFVVISAFVVIIAVIIWFISLFRFPVKKYVKSALYAICYEEMEEYEKLTNSSSNEAKESISEDLRTQAEAYASYFGVENLSDKSIEMLEDFSKDVYSYSKFKVKGAKRTKDGYTVTVKLKPISFSKISTKNIDKYIEEFNKRAEDSEFLYDADALYEEKFIEGLIEVYKKELDNIQYGKNKKVQITVKQSGANRYEADLTEVLNSLVDFQ